jgi:hypothetical protein
MMTMNKFYFEINLSKQERLSGSIKGFSKATKKEVYEDLHVVMNIK